MLRVALGHWPSLASLRQSGRQRLSFEASRLRALARAGEQVPEVLYQSDRVLVTEDVGTTVQEHLERLPVRDRAVLMRRLAADQARFHDAGQWHGAAQFRNLTLCGGVLHRIDFEENLEGVLPVRYRQVFDLFLIVHSLAERRALGSSCQREAMGARFLEEYLEHRQTEPPLIELLQLHRWLAAGSAALRWAARFGGRDVERALITSAAIQQVMPRVRALREYAQAR
ncbi:Mn2+dependent serine/threonine protein kinase [Thioalkalivibrio nitratireducens DSM 14787]|uniref:Mn2+dependent serine/threonine protein kinase n=1 Tax=Thioalkalivibrio nitratireducens (strain DSM 14787 / UNIQEM 213 / ALEN2) TaxID=1255043 RepID=L0DTT9_THIND|nr:Mn2+dependent serine/threonine protein kinase [Thioalkalivibrio nitratireducens DSM 14787]